MLSTNRLNFGNIYIMKFTTWLDMELDKRHWNHSELARQINMTEAAISHVFTDNKSHKRNPGPDMCKAIAEALGLPPEIVYRQAGLLPAEIENPPNFDELKYWFTQMTDEEQEMFLAQGRLTIEIRNRRPKEKRQQVNPEMD